MRTLRFYDKEGLLSPSQYSDAGYRLYSDDDLAELQQILALKFLGFTLEEIRMFMQVGPERFKEALAKQKAMMKDRRSQLDAIIQAIDHAEALLLKGECNWETITDVIEVIQMENKQDWVNKYFSPEEQETMQEISEKSYSDEAKRKMAGWDTWTEADQQRVDAQYAHIASELKRLVAAGADPADPAAQEVAKLQVELLNQFTQGDPEVEAGLNKWWENFESLPEAEKPPALPWNEEEGAFLWQAIDIYKQ